MEVIYRNNSKNKVNIPKNVRQIGTDDGKFRVYIEDYAYSFVKDISIDDDDDGAVGILMGEACESDGIKYIFIKGVLEVTNAAVFTDHIAFTSETWSITKRYIQRYFGEYEIMGWYLSSSKITDKDMDIINKADKDNFSVNDNVFFLVNSVNGDGTFFKKSKNGLTAVSGYTVYFEKNVAMQNYMKEMQHDYSDKYAGQTEEEEPETKTNNSETKGQYRNIVKDSKKSSDKSIKRNLTMIYAFSMIVIIVVLVIGVNKINSYDKMGGFGETGSQEANVTVQEHTSKTPVTTLDGNVTEEPTTQESTTQEPTTEEPTTQEPTTEEPTTQEPTTQEPTTQAVQTYVIQQGDTLWALCTKFYGTYSETLANKILTYNNMTIYDIQVGKTIKIPPEK